MDMVTMSDREVVREIGRRLRRRRLERNWSQEQVAERAGLTRVTIARVEKGTPASLLTLIQILRALDAIDLADTDILFIENVGNLVCPASWDLGETAKVVLFAVTDGEDKPAKYPKMFRQSRYALFTKVDLLPHLTFEVDKAVACAKEVNPDLEFFYTSSTTGEGLELWYDFLRRAVATTRVV